MAQPKTLQEAIKYFSDYENCREFMMQLRWPDGKVACPQCGSTHVVYLEKARVWKCYSKHIKAKFSLKTGTIFEDSPLGLDKWLAAVWLIVNCKNGISSYELARHLGVTQKSGWFMLHRIRLAMQDGSGGKLGGDVEVDETYIGGKARNMSATRKRQRGHAGKGAGFAGKVAVMGLLERQTSGASRVKVQRVSSNRRSQLRPVIREHVEAGANVYTDALMSYYGLDAEYAHKVIDHAIAYADGQIHTNGLENFWSLLKRTLNGTYVSVEPFHLFRYLDEQAFRFNNRKDVDFERFKLVASQVIGRRVTFGELTGKVDLPETAS